MRARAKARLEWDRTHPPVDPAIFTRDIWPGLKELPLSALVDATGLSVMYCSRIRRGLKVPHPRHFDALWSLTRQTVNDYSI